MLTGLPVVGSVLSPVASLLDSIGLSDPSKLAANTPLTKDQQDVLKQLQSALMGAVGGVEASLPKGIPVTLPVALPIKRQFGDQGSGWGALFDEESGTLDPEDGLSGYLKREIMEARGLDSVLGGLPIVGSVLSPVTSILDSAGLGDITSKLPLTNDQKDLIAKLKAAISTVTSKVKDTLPVDLPIALPL